MKTLLQLQHCQHPLGQRLFGPFNLAIGLGERVALLGPSGAGKSTLLRIMTGELSVKHGMASLEGRCLSSWPLPELSKRRAVLPQSHHIAFGLRTDLVIALGRIARPRTHDTQDIVRAAADMAACEHLLSRHIDTLSGGEVARVHLARIFAQLWDVAPGLILVDEPLAALDPGLQHRLSRQLDQFARSRGHAVVAVLHDINHAVRYFERLLLLQEGKLIGDIPTAALEENMLQTLYGLPFSQAKLNDEQSVWLPAA